MTHILDENAASRRPTAIKRGGCARTTVLPPHLMGNLRVEASSGTIVGLVFRGSSRLSLLVIEGSIEGGEPSDPALWESETPSVLGDVFSRFNEERLLRSR